MSTWMVEWTCRWPMPGHWRAGCTCIKAGSGACTDARRSLVSIFEAGLRKLHFLTKKNPRHDLSHDPLQRAPVNGHVGGEFGHFLRFLAFPGVTGARTGSRRP